MIMISTIIKHGIALLNLPARVVPRTWSGLLTAKVLNNCLLLYRMHGYNAFQAVRMRSVIIIF